MKNVIKTRSILLFALLFLSPSCSKDADYSYNGYPYYSPPSTPAPWTASDVDEQVNSCVKSATAGSTADANDLKINQTFCGCLYQAIQKEWPDYNDYLSHSDSILRQVLSDGTYSKCYSQAVSEVGNQ